MLDILIPSYNSLRFLPRLIALKDIKGINILIADDSSDAKISQAIYLDAHKYGFKYFSGTRTGNPVDNWNFLLSISKSEFFMILHHDESIKVTKNFIEFIDKMSTNLDSKIFISELYIDNQIRQYRYQSSFLKKFILRRDLNYLWRRNIIGAPSNIILHKSMNDIRYNRNMSWLVDVDYFIRVIAGRENLLDFASYTIISHYNRASITSRIDKGVLAQLEKPANLPKNIIQNIILDFLVITDRTINGLVK